MAGKVGAALRKFVMLKTPLPPSRGLEFLNTMLRFGQWMRHHTHDLPTFADRAGLYGYLNEHVLRGEAMDYLEFGVYKGDTMRLWTSINKSAGSRFAGFDSFEGLPEKWSNLIGEMPAGTFDTGGVLPDIKDPRVRFVKGWFQKTLPGFLSTFEAKNRLVVHCDADLYSSTLYALTMLNGYLKPGSIVIFDEFSSVTHEFRALLDFSSAYQRKLVPLAYAGPFVNHVAFEVME
jgi:O-methyltransferase